MKNQEQLWTRKAVTVPTVLQMGVVDCGAACLGMILAYHGKQVPLEELRIACDVSRDGSKAGNVARAARQYGLKAQGYRRETIEELQTLHLPMVIFWNFNHFVVLRGIKGNRVYLNDPAVGPKRISIEEFDRLFTGIAIDFTPGENFQKGGTKPFLLTSLLNRLGRSKVALSFVLIASLLLVVPSLLIPTFYRIFVDKILVSQVMWLKPMLVAMGITILIQLVLTWLQQLCLSRLSVKLAAVSTTKMISRLLQFPMVFFCQRYPGDIQNRFLINERVVMLVSQTLATNFVHLFSMVFFAWIMFQYDGVLTTCGIIVVMLNLVALHLSNERRKNLNRSLLQDRSKMISVTCNGLQLIETIKASGMESDFFALWGGYQANTVNAQQKMTLSTIILDSAPTFLSTLTQGLVLIVGSIRIIQGDMSIGLLVAFQSLMTCFSDPVLKLVKLGADLQETHADVDRLDDLDNYQIDEQFTKSENESQSPPEKVKLDGNLELRNVSFGYSKLQNPLLQNFNLSLKPGQRVALVGQSGSGKSTVARLVAGLFEAWDGEILFDGKPRDAYPRQVINDSVAIVDQDIFLFKDSILANLTLWDSSIGDKDIAAASRDALIHDDIMARPGGYESVINEYGKNFSGGQRQRLEIARALTNTPSILVMDEATSALDPEMEKELDDNLRKRGITCLIIAHRLSTIRDCDEILVLDHGNVIERGTHETLMNKKGKYAELIKAD